MKAWERQESESEKAFAAFRAYLDSGEIRSIRSVAQRLGKSDTIIGRWSSKWRWLERVAAYNQHLLTKADRAKENEVIRQARKIISSNEVLEEITEIAECDWREFVEIRYGKDGEILNANLRLGDKLKALELAGKYHKLFTERTETVDLTETEKHKTVIANEIQRLRLRFADDDLAFEAEVARLRAMNSDRDDPAYDPLLDYTKHPENWPADIRVTVTPEPTDANN